MYEDAKYRAELQDAKPLLPEVIDFAETLVKMLSTYLKTLLPKCQALPNPHLKKRFGDNMLNPSYQIAKPLQPEEMDLLIVFYCFVVYLLSPIF